MKCPNCEKDHHSLCRSLHDGTKICRACYNSPEYAACTKCYEVYHIRYILRSVKESPICTGCYDALYHKTKIPGGN